MSSTFSMANQKLKQFFGATQTKDFNLEVQRDTYEIGSNKLNIFLSVLKRYEQLLLQMPLVLQKLYISFGDLNPKQVYYEAANYRQNYFKIIQSAKEKANNLNERYLYLRKQLSIQQQHIKKKQKQFEIVRQRYDHYKTKVEKLTKQFTSIQNSKPSKQAKEQLDRNVIKLTDSQVQYNKQVSNIRNKLQTYNKHFSDLAFGCYEIFSTDLCDFLIESAQQASNIKEFVNDRKIRGKQNTIMANKVPIQSLFDKKRMDFFPQLQNQFMNSNNILQKKRANTSSIFVQNIQKIDPSNEQQKMSRSTFDQFNFFKQQKAETLKNLFPVNQSKPVVTNQNIDLLGLF